MLTIKDVEAKVAEIRRLSGDDEAAHAEEDDLHQLVLQEIAIGQCEDPAGCAKAALETRKIKFTRWCA